MADNGKKLRRFFLQKTKVIGPGLPEADKPWDLLGQPIDRQILALSGEDTDQDSDHASLPAETPAYEIDNTPVVHILHGTPGVDLDEWANFFHEDETESQLAAGGNAPELFMIPPFTFAYTGPGSERLNNDEITKKHLNSIGHDIAQRRLMDYLKTLKDTGQSVVLPLADYGDGVFPILEDLRAQGYRLSVNICYQDFPQQGAYAWRSYAHSLINFIKLADMMDELSLSHGAGNIVLTLKQTARAEEDLNMTLIEEIDRQNLFEMPPEEAALELERREQGRAKIDEENYARAAGQLEPRYNRTEVDMRLSLTQSQISVNEEGLRKLIFSLASDGLRIQNGFVPLQGISEAEQEQFRPKLQKLMDKVAALLSEMSGVPYGLTRSLVERPIPPRMV